MTKYSKQSQNDIFKDKKFYLHIGLHKCASTTLQDYIFLKKNFNKEKFKVLTKKEDTKKILNLIDDFKSKKISLLECKKKLNFTFEDYNSILISHESLLGYHFDGFKDVNINFENYEKIFNKPKYLIVFRNQSDFLLSLWKHRIRKGYRAEFKKFINDGKNLGKKTSKFSVNFKYFDYNKIFQNYLTHAKNRSQFIDINDFHNEHIVKKKINFFLEPITLDKNYDPSIKKNYSNNVEIDYLFFYLNFKFLISPILLIIKFIFNFFCIIKIFKRPKYTNHYHFNLFGNVYLNLISFIFNKFYNFKIKKFNSDIENELKMIDNYYQNSNETFKNKII